jgi:hypothetical protein
MLTQGFCSSALVSLLLWPHGQTASCILLMPAPIPLTPFFFEGRLLSWYFSMGWISTLYLLNRLFHSLFLFREVLQFLQLLSPSSRPHLSFISSALSINARILFRRALKVDLLFF